MKIKVKSVYLLVIINIKWCFYSKDTQYFFIFFYLMFVVVLRTNYNLVLLNNFLIFFLSPIFKINIDINMQTLH